MSDLFLVRPTGAAADLKELEYCTALAQTEPGHIRNNATISSLDILHMLRSRYNIRLTHEQTLQIVRGLSGDGYHISKEGKTLESTNARMEETDDQVNSDEQHVSKDDTKVEKTKIRIFLERMRQKQQTSQLVHESVNEEDEQHQQIPAPSDDTVEEYLDLVQILSTLLIPSFARLAQNGSTDDSSYWEKEGEFSTAVAWKDAWDNFVQKTSAAPSAAPPTPNIFGPALKSMLRDLPENPTITEELIEYLLLKYGEFERAADPELIRDMTRLAQSCASPDHTLTEQALLLASTKDLGLWNVESERRLSTLFFDIFEELEPAKVTKLVSEESKTDIDENDGETSEKDKAAKMAPANKVIDAEWTNLDMTVDSHVSLLTTELIWVFFFCIVVMYGSEVLTATNFQDSCDLEDFWCDILYAIYSWAFTAIVFSTFGLIQIGPLSAGNNPYNRSVVAKVVAACAAVVYSVFPYITKTLTEEDEGESRQINATLIDNFGKSSILMPSGGEDDFSDNVTNAFQIICLAFGLFLAALFLLQAVILVVFSPKDGAETNEKSRYMVSHALIGDAAIKRAANYKLTKLLVNANVLHDPNASEHFVKKNECFETIQKGDVAMKNFVLYGEQYKEAGGILWTWRRILTGSLFEEDGIRFGSRLMIIQFGQICASVILVGVLLGRTANLAREAEEARDSLPPEVPNWVRDLVPEAWMLEVSLYPAGAVAGLVCFALIALYIPSTVATILKYRGQIKPSINSPSFLPFRNAVDTAYMNLGNAIYGLVAAALLWYVVIFAFIFIYVWPISRDGALWLTAWGLGLGITIGIKMVITMICQSIQYRAFFRIRPQAARLSTLALECWFIGLGGGVLLTRLGQILGGALFWIGRIDVPFMTEDVSLAGIGLDMVPTYFLKDILMREAHRHPYMERLAQMYLLKARFPHTFVSRAGTAWRHLILLAFMPWLARYRVFGEQRRGQALEALRKRDKRKEDGASVHEAE